MNENTQIHIDQQVGLTMAGIEFEHLPNHGQPCWKATAKIGTIFGQEVDGELVGIGRTKEAALAMLEAEQQRLHESLWA